MAPVTFKLGLITAGLAGTLACATTAPPVSGVGRLSLGSTWVLSGVLMDNAQGAQASLQSVRGERGTLVVFTCNHCPWAKAWEARIVALAERFAPQGIGSIALNPNDPGRHPEDGFQQMQERVQEAAYTFPYVVDRGGRLARAFGVTKTPEVFVFDAQDKLVYVGAVDDNAYNPGQVEVPYLARALESLVKGDRIEVTATKTLGCGIAP